jgi:adenosylmethionine-8-amino-7-oxononanoate aminotransferase
MRTGTYGAISHGTAPGSPPPTITRGEGVTIWDDKGKSYIDGTTTLGRVEPV